MQHQPSGAPLTPPIAQVSAVCLPFPKTKCNDLITIIKVFILCRHVVLLCDITIILKLRQMNLLHILGRKYILLHFKFLSYS